MKYIKRKIWDNYLIEYLKELKKEMNNIPQDPNKGIQFEILVEYLLHKMFSAEELSFKKTKLSHDGNKDFWAIDNTSEVWWAECKNYTPNIALTQLAPTLVMAEINQVRHLMFFSYSSINANLRKRIAQYSYKYQKEIFLYDDEALEQLVFLYDKDILPSKYDFGSYNYSEKLETYFFNEINSSVVNQNIFNENYEITELNVGTIYDLNVILINRYHNKELKVKVTIADSLSNLYFDFLNKDLNTPLQDWEDELLIKPNQIVLAKYSVLAKKENNKITLPQILVSYEVNGKPYQKKNTKNKDYVCNWNKKIVLIGKHYENIINKFSLDCKKSLCMLLVYGSGGTGKTRILEECRGKLINNRYNIISFIGFDNGTSWKDIIVQIAFQIFGLEQDLVSTITLEMEDIVLSTLQESLKTKIVKFLRLLKKEETTDDLDEFYEVIFSELSRNKYAIIIDNLQSYSTEILTFLKKMIQFLGTHLKHKNSFALLISLNTSLVYDNKYLDFIASFQTLSYSENNISISCENITGFTKEQQAITYLKTLLCLDDYPLNYKYLRDALAKSSFKPKYIELIAGRLFQEECIHIENNKGVITDTKLFKKIIDEIPPKYEDAFCSNYRCLQSFYPVLVEDFKDIIACTYFFNIISNRVIDLLGLNKYAILPLVKHGILKKTEWTNEPSYKFEHDLVEMTLCEKIYPDLMEYAISFIIKHGNIYETTLKEQYEQYILCKLFSKQVTKEELISIYEQKVLNKTNNKFVFKFCSYFIDNIIRLKSQFTNVAIVQYMNDCCKYIRDNVSEIQAEHLFDLVYSHIKELPQDTKEIMAFYFSFIIHFCENKMRLSKPYECLSIYRNYYKQLEQLEKKFATFITEFKYARAYLDNRIFVCGKLEGNSMKYLDNAFLSLKASKKNNFWDIQLENYFDLSNLYLDEKINAKKALRNLEKGFYCFEQMTEQQKQKYIVNYYSKKILYFLLKHNYSSSLEIIEIAMTELKENTHVNYQLFFREKYKKYEIITLMLLNNFTTTLDECMEEYEQLLALTGHLQDNFEWIFLQAKYAFYIKNNLNFKNFVKKFYCKYCNGNGSTANSKKNYIMLKELVIKYKQTNTSCDFIQERVEKLSEINKILKMDTASFHHFFMNYKSTAPITSENYKDGYMA